MLWNILCRENKLSNSKHIRNSKCKQKHVFRHFNGEGQKTFFKNVSITLIDKADGNDSRKWALLEKDIKDLCTFRT